MKKIFDRLIAKLEDVSMMDEYGKIVELEDAIEIVFQMAEEYKEYICIRNLPEGYDLDEQFYHDNMWDADEKWAFENGYNACLKDILGDRYAG